MLRIHYHIYYTLLNCNYILISRIFYIQWYKYQLDPSFLKGVKFYHFYCHIFKLTNYHWSWFKKGCQIIIDHDLKKGLFFIFIFSKLPNYYWSWFKKVYVFYCHIFKVAKLWLIMIQKKCMFFTVLFSKLLEYSGVA